MRKLLLVAVLFFTGMQVQAQYCSGGPSSTADSQIDLFEITGENSSSIDTVLSCANVGTGLTDFTSADTAEVYRDSSYTISLRAGTCGGTYTNRLTVYVDWNQNGSFESVELVDWVGGLGGGASATQLMTLTVPSGISTGSTRMRVIQHETSALSPTGPCETYSWGSMNDYTLTIAGPASSCPTPYALMASGISADKTTLSWTTTAASTQIAVVPADSVVKSTDFVATSGINTTVSGLLANTDYVAYAYDSCGSDTATATLRTLCSIFSTPFLEDFDGGNWAAAVSNYGTDGYLNPCWSTDASGFNNLYQAWVVGEGTTPSGASLTSNYSAGPIGDAGTGYGNYMFVEGSNYFYSSSARLETPLIDLGSLTQPYLSFDAHLWQNYQSSSYTPILSIEVSNDLGVTWTSYEINSGPFASQPTKASAYENIGIALSEYVNDTVQIAFVLENFYAYNDLAIDNISIDNAPACYKPIASIDSLSYTYVDFSYLSYNMVNWYYTTANATAKTSGTTVTSPFTVSSLSSDSTYTFSFYNNCATGFSDTVQLTLTPPTFNACGANTVYPLTESFELSSAKKGCWTTEVVSGFRDWNTSADGSTYGTPNTAWKGSLYAELPYSSSGVARLISPVLDMTAYSTAQVTFALFNEEWFGDQNTLSVEYRLSDTDPWIETYSSSTSYSSWDTTQIAYALATSATMQFAFKGDLSWGYNIGIDSVVFDAGPTCLPPMGLTAYDVTSNGASIAWSGLTQNYLVDYGLPGSAAFLLAATNDSVSIASLSPSTQYYAAVRADCGAGTYSGYSDTLFFTTLCLPSAVGLYEGFENTTNPDNLYGPSTNSSLIYDAVPNNCWSSVNIGGSTYAYSLIYEPTGSYYLTNYPPNVGDRYMYVYATSNQDIALITPQLTGLGSGLNQIRFNYYNYSSSYSNMYIVASNNTQGFDPANSNIIYLDTLDYGTGANTWEEKLVEVPVLPAGYEYIYFGKPDGSFSYIRMDEFNYEAQPTCKPATGLDIVNVTNSAATVNVMGGAPASWQLELVEPFLNSSTSALDFSQGTGVKSTISNSTGNLSALTSDAQYGVYARKLCGAGDTSDWRGPYVFKTDCDANNTFPYVMEFESDWESDKGCWDTSYTGGPSFYGAEVYYTTSTFSPMTSRGLRFYSYGNYGYGSPETVTTQALSIPSTGASLGFKYGSYDSDPAGVPATLAFGVMAQEVGQSKWDTISMITGSDVVTTSSAYADRYKTEGFKQLMVPTSLFGKDVKFKLAFYGQSGGPSYFMVDSLTLGTPPTCPEPENGAQIAATSSSVTISWDSPLAQNKGSRVRWGTTAFMQATGVGMIGDTNAVLTPFTISGLGADSTYHVFVQDSCSVTDTTSWFGPFAVTTACDVAVAPYGVSFDNGLDGCWYNTGGADLWRSTSFTPGYAASSFVNRSGSGYAMWVDGSNPNDNANPPVLTSRTVDISALTQPEVEFFVGSYNVNNADSNILVVNVIDATGKTDSALVYSGMDPDWVRQSIDLSSYTSPVSVEFVVYMDANGTAVFYNDIIVDDVNFAEKRNCFSASNAIASNIAANTATVTWDAGSSTGTSWIVNVENTLLQTVASYTATSTSISLSGLSGGSEYCVSVQELCSVTGDTTAATTPVCFSTQCGTVYAPYAQDFSSYTYDFNCWTRSTNVAAQGSATLWTGTYGDWMFGGVQDVWGNTSTNSTWRSTLNNYAIGVDGSAPFSAIPVISSPMIDVSSLFKPQLKFQTISGQLGDTVVTWLGDTVSNGQNTLVVDLWDGSSWNDSVYVNNSDMVAWDSVLIELNQFSISGPVQVRFTVNKTAVIPAFDDILLDNFSITEDPAILTCSDIDTAFAFDISCSEASIMWGQLDTSGVYSQGSSDSNRIGTIVYVGMDSMAVELQTGTSYFTSDTIVNVTGLSPGTDYYFWAMDSCISGNTSAMIGPYMFTTDTVPMPTLPTTVTLVNDTVTTVSTWTVTVIGDTTQTYVMVIDGMTYTGMTATVTFAANGTVPVSLSISNDCGTIDTAYTIDVTQINVEENAITDAKVYPNPSMGNFNLEFSSIEGLDYSVQVMDPLGRIISTKQGVTSVTNVVRFDSNLPSGVYVIKTIVGSETIIDRVSIRN